MQFPAIIVNFKTYETAIGEAALRLARLHDEVAGETGASLAVCVSAFDLRMIASAVKIPVFVQHVDPVGYGAFTGFLPPKAAKEAGAYGVLLNHAEHQLEESVLERTIDACKKVGLKTLVCVEHPERAAEMLRHNPDFIAVEPPELIGGDVSVSHAKPEIISKSVELARGYAVLVGAGVKSAEDVKKSLELGAKGVLLASGVTKASDPKKVLHDLIKGLQ